MRSLLLTTAALAALTTPALAATAVDEVIVTAARLPSSPEVITGAHVIDRAEIEARGVGIVTAPTWPLARVVLAVEAEEAPSERLPEPAARMIAGVAVPLLTLDLKQASAVAKVAVALQTL